MVYGCVLVLQTIALADGQLISTKVSDMKAAAGEMFFLVIQACGVRRDGSELCSSKQHPKGPMFCQGSTDLSP